MRVLLGGVGRHHVASCLDSPTVLLVVCVIPALLQEFVVCRENGLIGAMVCHVANRNVKLCSFNDQLPF